MEISEFRYNTVKKYVKKASMPKTGSIRPVVSIQTVDTNVNCPGPTPSSVDVALAEMLDSLGLTQLVGLLRVAAEVILCAV